MIGINSLSAELLKNVVLAGVSLITIIPTISLSDNILKKNELANNSNFFFTVEDVGMKKIEIFCKKIKQLNPQVEINCCEKHDISEDLIKQYSLVCFTEKDLEFAKKVNKICKINKTKFLFGCCLGFYSIVFVDFGEHFYKHTVKVKEQESIKERLLKYNTLDQALKNIKINSKKQTKIKHFAFFIFIICVLKSGKNLNCFNKDEISSNLLDTWKNMLHEIRTNTINSERELNLEKNFQFLDKTVQTYIENHLDYDSDIPSCSSVIGGLMAQEVTKLFTLKDQPIDNFLCYNGLEADAVVHTLKADIE